MPSAFGDTGGERLNLTNRGAGAAGRWGGKNRDVMGEVAVGQGQVQVIDGADCDRHVVQHGRERLGHRVVLAQRLQHPQDVEDGDVLESDREFEVGGCEHGSVVGAVAQVNTAGRSGAAAGGCGGIDLFVPQGGFVVLSLGLVVHRYRQ